MGEPASERSGSGLGRLLRRLCICRKEHKDEEVKDQEAKYEEAKYEEAKSDKAKGDKARGEEQCEYTEDCCSSAVEKWVGEEMEKDASITSSCASLSASLRSPLDRLSRLRRQCSRSESCLQATGGIPISSLPPHMRGQGGSSTSLRREVVRASRSCDPVTREAFRAGSLNRSNTNFLDATLYVAFSRYRILTK